MRNRWVLLTIGLALAASLGMARYGRGQERGRLRGASEAVRIDPAAEGVLILLGRGDTEPTAWDGSLSVTGGSLTHLEGWRFRQQDQITGPGSWRASTRRQALRPAQQRLGQNAPMAPTGVVALLKTSPQTEVRVTTPRGEFRFSPAQLSPGRPALFLDGAASAERVPADFQLTAAETEDDFPAAAMGKNGDLWVAYVSYDYGQPRLPYARPMPQEPTNFDFLKPKGNGDQVRLARLSPQGDSATWSVVADLTEPGQDVYRPAIAADGAGSVWVVWSQNVQGNWDLYARRYRDGDLSRPMRLTMDTGSDLSPAMARDDRGTIWLAWQGFRGGQADIFLTSLPSGSDRWSEPMRVSTSPRNDWDPAVGCAHDGSVYVAWDTYDRGDYDVLMRRVTAGGQSQGRPVLGPAIPVAATPLFEARPSLACDTQNRVWVAWEEAPERWGKDFGYYVQDQAVPLYRGHTVAVRCFVDGKPYATAGDLADAFTVGLAQQAPAPAARAQRAARLGPAARRAAATQQSFPRLGIDGSGRISLTYRQAIPAMQSPTGTAWYSFVTTYEGNSWSPAAIVPNSDGLLDGRPALLSGGPNGTLYIVHSADGRGHAFGRDPRYELYVATIHPAGPETARAAEPELVAEETPAPRGPDPLVVSERADLDRIRGFRTRMGGKTYQLLRGDFHRHTEISPDGGGDGPLIDMFRYAIDAAAQDWICAGDHDYGAGREYTWWQIQKLDDAFHLGTRFVPLFGYERSVRYPDGHRNVMFVQRGIRALPRLAGDQPNNVSPNDTKMLYRYLRQFDGICASHTSATDMGTDWRDNDPKLEPFVEIYQGDRQNYEYQGAPRSGTAQDSPGGFQPAGFVWNALAKGYRFGFQSSSDHISTHISYAVAYAEQPTREAIQDAFRKRHCYGATDNIVLEVRSGDHLMGDEFEARAAPRLQIRATGTRPIKQLVVVKDNRVVHTVSPGKADVDLTWMDSDPRPGVSYYYVRVEQEDGQLAWASPMWIHSRS